jgi:hypothetical protein
MALEMNDRTTMATMGIVLVLSVGVVGLLVREARKMIRLRELNKTGKSKREEQSSSFLRRENETDEHSGKKRCQECSVTDEV